MKRLILFALFAATAWYGWTHFRGLRGPGLNEAVIVNQSDRALERLRLNVGSETLVVEHLDAGARTTRPFRGGVDATFKLVWVYQGLLGEQQWAGGTLTSGPIRMRHTFLVSGNGSVIWNNEVVTERK